MRFLLVCLLFVGIQAPAGAQAPSFQEAQQRLWRGNYAEARGMFEALAKQPQDKVAATIGLSRGWQSEGEYDKALAVIDAAIKNAPTAADLLARRAEILFLRGQWDDAQEAVKKALATD